MSSFRISYGQVSRIAIEIDDRPYYVIDWWYFTKSSPQFNNELSMPRVGPSLPHFTTRAVNMSRTDINRLITPILASLFISTESGYFGRANISTKTLIIRHYHAMRKRVTSFIMDNECRSISNYLRLDTVPHYGMPHRISLSSIGW
jgi:hypothetical protein